LCNHTRSSSSNLLVYWIRSSGPKQSIFNLIIKKKKYRLHHAFSKICYVMQNMARSSKQSTSAPPADAVARSPRATVAEKSPRVVLSPRSRTAFEQRREQHRAHVAAVTEFYMKQKLPRMPPLLQMLKLSLTPPLLLQVP
jgi:hypothetical protein